MKSLARQVSRVTNPAQFIMDRLSFAGKFLLLALIMLAPLVFVGYRYLGVQNAQYDFSAKEEVGIKYILPMSELLNDLVSARSAAVQAAAHKPGATEQLAALKLAVAAETRKVNTADALYGVDLKTTSDWKTLRATIDEAFAATNATPMKAYERWNKVSDAALALILTAGNNSNLILDPDLDTYYLMDSHVIRIVTLMDLAGRSRDLETVVDLERLRGDALVEQRLTLSRQLGQIDFNLDTLKGNYAVLFKETAGLRGAESAKITEREVHAPFDATLAKIVALRTSVNDAVEGHPDSLKADIEADIAVTALRDLQRSSSKEETRLIDERLSLFTANKKVTFIVSGLTVALAMLLFIGLYKSLRHSLLELLSASRRIGDGELNVNVDVRSRDEVGQMAASFRMMTANLGDMASAARRISVGDVNVDVQPRSERDELGLAFAEMIIYLQRARDVADRIAQGDLDVTITQSSEADALGQAFARMVTYLRETSEAAGVPFSELLDHIGHQAQVAERIAEGDLTIDVAPRSEQDALGHAFQRMVGNLRLMVSDLTDAASDVDRSSQHLAVTSRDVTSGMEDVAHSVGTLAVGS
ncbi:MAG: HAMP domain-containing protein, partial [Thermoleophilia bacterium]|nr:HAMP domain-containing protein [Thermoleophilia bacterium]